MKTQELDELGKFIQDDYSKWIRHFVDIAVKYCIENHLEPNYNGLREIVFDFFDSYAEMN